MSNRVRALKRCASSSLPWSLNCSSRSFSSCLISSTAPAMRSSGSTKCFEG